MVDIRLLEYFITVVEVGSISKAALKLHLTQPTLTRQIQQLEEIYNTKLFIRSNRKLTLTESGITLKKRALEIIELHYKTINEIKDNEKELSGEIIIGSGETVGSNYLPKIISEFSKDYPNVLFKIHTTSSDDSKEKINEGLFDIAIALEPIDKQLFNTFKLPIKDEWVLYLRKDDPLSNKKDIKPSDIKDLKIAFPHRKATQLKFVEWYGNDEILNNIVTTFDLNLNLGLLVQSGYCYGVTIKGAIEHSFKDTLTYIPLQPKVTSSAYIIWKKGPVTNKALLKLIEYIK